VKRDHALRSQSDGIKIESLGIGLLNQRLEPFRMTIEPGAGNLDDPISHSGEEFVHCLEGEIEYCVGDRVFRLEPGDSLLFEATQPHACHNPHGRPASILLVIQVAQDTRLARQLHLET
jgi:quercetin dioxygenase-like cupin family protein